MTIFNKTFWTYTPSLHQNNGKGSISKFNFQNSKISLAPLIRFLTVSKEILVHVACLRCLRVSKRPWSNFVTLTSLWPLLQVASLSVVSLTEACLFYCQTVGNAFADDKLYVHYIQKCVARQHHVYLLQEVKTRYFCIFLIAWTAT